ncbi:hypothetical protein J5N97_007326 [Dioscorea zingiberensis]|uniref:IBH1-like N-terminal domain-containing protein n=1 Tax=Dioscorea zingiberensis TaxID=325984 RepID=A0A9D5DC26_9LILI|nr:hypothetical protein J5N97_007326 [Dioscorea zingiberensis]
MKGGNPNPNPNSNPKKPLLANHFIQALTRINLAAQTSSTRQRSHCIKRAAYVSMACAAGSRRAWSRAMLQKIRLRSRVLRLPGDRRSIVSVVRREENRADVLRKLLPGGQAMEFSSLLEETASYIQYLSAQVRLMQTIVDSMFG